MKYRSGARLNTGEVRDTRRGGGGRALGGRGITVGGGGLGLVVVAVIVIVNLVGGGSGSDAASLLDQLGQSGQGTADNTEISKECRTGQDANDHLECAVVADVDSIQQYWARELPRLGTRYTAVPTVWFTGQVSTGCGSADSGAGPFYCPADKQVYIDLSFYDDLRTQFGAQGGLFVDAYVLAHEYGHHVQDLLGTESKVRTRSGPNSDSVRLELQADCYAGVWAEHATEPDGSGSALIESITADDISRALDTAGRIGDDYIQRNLGSGTVDRSTFTHGTSEQRRRWFTTGYETGEPGRCDTFGARSLG